MGNNSATNDQETVTLTVFKNSPQIGAGGLGNSESGVHV